jgi:hypothetical protein
MKVFIYPLTILTIFAVIIFVVLATTRKVGLEMNTYYNVEMSLDNIQTFNVWKKDTVFYVSPEGPKNISDSNVSQVDGALRLTEKGLFKSSVFFILRFDSGREDLNEFLHQLSKHELKQVMIASPNDSTLRNLRSLESNFYYAPSIKTLLKWSVFSRLFIEPIFNLDSDFIFVDSRVESLLNPSLKLELERRKLPVCTYKDTLECKI